MNMVANGFEITNPEVYSVMYAITARCLQKCASDEAPQTLFKISYYYHK